MFLCLVGVGCWERVRSSNQWSGPLHLVLQAIFRLLPRVGHVYWSRWQSQRQPPIPHSASRREWPCVGCCMSLVAPERRRIVRRLTPLEPGVLGVVWSRLSCRGTLWVFVPPRRLCWPRACSAPAIFLPCNMRGRSWSTCGVPSVSSVVDPWFDVLRVPRSWELSHLVFLHRSSSYHVPRSVS